jgi:hypothetical protein
MKTVVIAIGFILASAFSTIGYADPGSRVISGTGSWTMTREHRRTVAEIDSRKESGSIDGNVPKEWSVEARVLGDRSISGAVNLTLAERRVAGRLHGRVEGRRVWGDILDDDGELLATFEGTATSAGIRGTFTAINDDTGEWTWDGPLPR